MRKFLIVLLLGMAFVIPVFSGTATGAESDSLYGNYFTEGIVYCERTDLEEASGEDRIAGWSRMDSAAVDRAAMPELKKIAEFAGSELDALHGNAQRFRAPHSCRSGGFKFAWV
ncbi:MAG: hypothetical protein LBU66_03170 [Treponema sp.]|jgi:hypothetical protein|nr:hypothetical protein [Treponema sp.]